LYINDINKFIYFLKTQDFSCFEFVILKPPLSPPASLVIPNWLQNKANLRAVVLCPYLVIQHLSSYGFLLKSQIGQTLNLFQGDNFVKVNKKSAFTLLEVLVTLVIIGIVAALTIPSMITNIQNQQKIIAWKKAYSVIEQAQLYMISDNGSVASTFTGIDHTAVGNNAFMNAWKPYLNVIKTCMSGRILLDKCYNSQFAYLDSSPIANYNSQNAGIVLNDGIFISFYRGFCGVENLCSDSHLYVDVNGIKPPNVFGIDVFDIRFMPIKAKFETFGNSSSCSGTGIYCGPYYLLH